jgi:hypothetical protein
VFSQLCNAVDKVPPARLILADESVLLLLHRCPLSSALASPSHAITGSRSAPSSSVAQSIVTVVAAGGGVCTGTMIAPNIILTAAHCIAPGTANRVIDYSSKPPALIAPQQVAVHPKYNAQSIAAHRATADVALLRLSAPMLGKSAAPLGLPRVPFTRYRALRLWASDRRSRAAILASAPFAPRRWPSPASPAHCKCVWSIRKPEQEFRHGRLYRRLGRARIRGSGRPQRHHRRGELVDGSEQCCRLRRPHRRHTPDII